VVQCVRCKYAQVYSAFCKMSQILFPCRKCDTHFSLTYGPAKTGGTMRVQLFHMKCSVLCNTLYLSVQNVTHTFAHSHVWFRQNGRHDEGATISYEMYCAM